MRRRSRWDASRGRVDVDTRLRDPSGDWQGLTPPRSSTLSPGVRAAGATTRLAPHGGRARSTSPRAAYRWSPRTRCTPAGMGCRQVRPSGGAGRPWRIDRGAHGGAARPSVDNWPVLGGMGNASWVQLSGHGPTAARRSDSPTSGGAWTCGTPRRRSPMMSSEPPERPKLLIFCDSLSLRPHRRSAVRRPESGRISVQPTRLGCRADQADRLDLLRRVGGPPPRTRGRGPRCGIPAVVFATGGMDSLPLTAADGDARTDPVNRPATLRRWVGTAVTAGCNPGCPRSRDAALPPHLTAGIWNDPGGNRFQPAEYRWWHRCQCASPTPVGRTGAGGHRGHADHGWAAEHDVPAGGPSRGRGGPEMAPAGAIRMASTGTSPRTRTSPT